MSIIPHNPVNAREQQTVAVVDVGSNSIKGRVVDVTSPAAPLILEQVRYPVRLGRGVFADGAIAADDLRQAREAFIDFTRRCTEFHVSAPVMAVGTSALREATNATELIDDVARHAGVTIRVISGADEARLVGLSASVHFRTATPHLVLDIGGGSTEILTTDGRGQLISARSLPLGAVRLTQEIDNPDVFSADMIDDLRRRVRGELAATYPGGIGGEGDLAQAIGTGGTIKAVHVALAAMTDEQVRTGEPDTFDAADVQRLVRAVTGCPTAELPQRFAIQPDRAGIVIPGMVILTETLEAFHVPEITVRECGVREGLVAEYLQRTAREKSGAGTVN